MIKDGALKPIQKLVLGGLRTNCYIVESAAHFLVVDPAGKSETIINAIKTSSLGSAGSTKPKQVDIFLTHGHFDHINAVPSIARSYPQSKIFISRKDLDMCIDPELNLSAVLNKSTTLRDFLPRMIFIQDGNCLSIGQEAFNIVGIPGHTPGSLGLYSKLRNCVFVGDTLFKSTIGADNRPKVDTESLINSIKTKLFSLPDSTIVLPGHGPETTIGYEKEYNRFLGKQAWKAVNFDTDVSH